MSRCSTARISSPPDFLSVSSATSYSLRTSGGIASALSYSWPLKPIFRLTAQGMARRTPGARGRALPEPQLEEQGQRGQLLQPAHPRRRGEIVALQGVLHPQRRRADAVREAGRRAERPVRTPQSARGHRGQERRPPHAMDGVPGERHPGRGAEAHQSPGLTTELCRIGSARRSGFEGEPRDRDDPGLHTELPHVAIEDALRAEERATEGAHRHGDPRAETNGAYPPEDRTERAFDAEACVDPVLGEGHERRDGQRALRGRGRGAQDRAPDHTGCPHRPVPSPAAGGPGTTGGPNPAAVGPPTPTVAESRSARPPAVPGTV